MKNMPTRKPIPSAPSRNFSGIAVGYWLSAAQCGFRTRKSECMQRPRNSPHSVNRLHGTSFIRSDLISRRKNTSTVQPNPAIASSGKQAKQRARHGLLLMLATPLIRNFDERSVAGDFIAFHQHLHSHERMIRRIRRSHRLRFVERLILLPDQFVVQPLRLLLRRRFDQRPAR